MKILLDIDNVLADFSRAIAEKLKIEVLPSYDFYEGQCSKQEFYSAMDYEFWATLPLFEHSLELFDVCHAIAEGNVALCTATCGYGLARQHCMSGKEAWRNKHFLGTELIFSRNKHEYADAGTLLIDDKYENCTNFITAGGRAILWPAHHTGSLGSAIASLDELAIYLKHWYRLRNEPSRYSRH